MSTRCKIRVKDKDGHIDLYRRYDGFPYRAGFDLVEVLRRCVEESDVRDYDKNELYIDDFIRGLLASETDQVVYRFETSCEDVYPEWGYIVDIDARTIECYGGERFKWYSNAIVFDEHYDMIEMYKGLKHFRDNPHIWAAIQDYDKCAHTPEDPPQTIEL